jgi:hypothetical protein
MARLACSKKFVRGAFRRPNSAWSDLCATTASGPAIKGASRRRLTQTIHCRWRRICLSASLSPQSQPGLEGRHDLRLDRRGFFILGGGVGPVQSCPEEVCQVFCSTSISRYDDHPAPARGQRRCPQHEAVDSRLTAVPSLPTGSPRASPSAWTRRCAACPNQIAEQDPILTESPCLPRRGEPRFASALR